MLGFSGTPPIVRLLTRAWHAALVVLAFMLPFELKMPWLDLRGALVFTNVELVALVAFGLWLARQVAVKQPPRWRALGAAALPMALLLATLLLASAFAPSDNLNALKVTARWLAGMMVCWMTVEAVHAGLSGQRLTCVVVVSGVIVALVAAVEYRWADNATVSAALNAFRVDTDFRVGGELRPSATLAYPTITAMVLEFAFVFAAGWLSRDVLCGASTTRCVAQQRGTGCACSARRALQVLCGLLRSPPVGSPVQRGFATLRAKRGHRKNGRHRKGRESGSSDHTGLAQAWARRRWLRSVALGAALLLVGTALVLTLTRSALAAIALALLLVLVVRWPRARLDLFARVALLAIGVLGVSLFVAALLNPLLALRLGSASDRDWYLAEYDAPPLPPLRAGETVTLNVTVRNVGQREWEARGPNAIFLNHHWLSADGKMLIVAETAHVPIAHNVVPGESIAVQTQVQGLAEPGDYLLAWDMLRNDLFWFSVLGAPMGEMRVRVLPGDAPPPSPAEARPRVPTIPGGLNADRPTLWRAALAMLAAHPLLGVGPGNYRLALGTVLNTQQWDTRLHANNTYLELFADAGVLGGIAFLWLVAAIARLGWRTVRGDPSAYGATLAAALAAFFIHGVTDYFLEFTPIYLLFWLTVGLLVAQATATDNQRGW